MLRKRSRTVTSNKQTLVSDHSSNNNNTNNINSSSSEKSQKATSFLFNSPRIFKDFFLSKDNSSTLMSPSSVLESKPLFSSVFPTCPPHQWLDPQSLPSAKHSWEHPGIGLALIDHDHDDDDEWVPKNKPCKEKRSKLVVFGSQLKIQIPPLPLPNQPPQTPLFPPPPPTSSPQSPREFGIKTPKSNLLGHLFVNSFQPEKRSLSVKDMELSEDYTCVISHGPNPKTTHIFGNCIVEAAENSYTRIRDSPPSEELDFLSFCHHCNKKIGQGKDIYMYRGERAFCSQECRGQEMLFDGIES